MATNDTDFGELANRIDHAMQADRYRLRRALDLIRQAARDRKPFDRKLRQLKQSLDQSAELCQRRVPSVTSI
jgi:hypothetical protein